MNTDKDLHQNKLLLIFNMAKKLLHQNYFFPFSFSKQKKNKQKNSQTFLLQLKLRPGEVYDPKVRVHEKTERKHKHSQTFSLCLSLWL